MRCKSLFRDFIHALCANLHFHPLSSWTHHRGMQGFVTIRLRRRYPIPQTIRVRSVEVCDNGVDFPAFSFFLFVDNIDYDEYRKQVIVLFKRNRLFLHFVPNGMERVRLAEYIRLEAMDGKNFIDRCDKICYKT